MYINVNESRFNFFKDQHCFDFLFITNVKVQILSVLNPNCIFTVRTKTQKYYSVHSKMYFCTFIHQTLQK